MSRLLQDIAASVMKHGFRKLLILNSHGGNRAALAYSIQAMAHRFPDSLIVGATYWDLVTKELSQMRETEFGGMGHACELETSILLSIAPKLVDLSKAEPDGMTLSESEFGRNELLSSSAITVYKTFRGDEQPWRTWRSSDSHCGKGRTLSQNHYSRREAFVRRHAGGKDLNEGGD